MPSFWQQNVAGYIILLSNLLPLLIPLLNPSIGADCLKVLGKELARLVFLTLCVDHINSYNLLEFQTLIFWQRWKST